MWMPINNQYVKHIKTGRIGFATQGEGDLLVVAFRDVGVLDPEIIQIPKDEVTFITLPELKGPVIKALIRGEEDLYSATDSVCFLGDIAHTNKYRMKPSDILYGIKTLLIGTDIDRTASYLFVVASIGMQILPNQTEGSDFDDRDILDHIIARLNNLLGEILKYGAKSNIDSVKAFLTDVEKELASYIKNGEISSSVYKTFLSKTTPDDACLEGNDYMIKYKSALEMLCKEKDAMAMEYRGYCYYTGNAMYEQDFVKSEKDLSEVYSMTGSPSVANSLGYIYYYGRCNNGEPQYDEAFRFFSVGHAGNMTESTYKLGDMFARGLSVAPNGDIAMNLYWSVYNYCFSEIRREWFDSKFADVALRMGNCYMKGTGCDIDYETAYSYYLQAEFAIKKRISDSDQYGDNVVYKAVKKALKEARKQYRKHDDKALFIAPQWVYWLGLGERSSVLRLAPMPDGSVLIEGRLLPSRKDNDVLPKIMVVIPQADYCALKSKLFIRTAPKSSFEIYGNSEKIVYNNVSYDEMTGVTTFLLDGIPAGRITTEYFTVSAPSPSDTDVFRGKKYRFVSVCFEGSDRRYDYLCDDKDVKAGDKVWVVTSSGDTEVSVTDVFDRYEDELNMPLNQYKKARKIR